MFRRSLKISALLISLAFLSAPAHAGLMLEPYLGYSQGHAANVLPSVDSSYDTSNVVAGGRLGYTFPALLWVALDYSLGAGGKAKSNSNNLEADLSRSDLYATVGFDFPVLFRAWIGYGLMNSSKTSRSGLEEKYEGGTNLKAGLGISVFPMVSFNIEAFSHKGQKMNVGGNSTTLSDFHDSGGILSLSVPLDL